MDQLINNLLMNILLISVADTEIPYLCYMSDKKTVEVAGEEKPVYDNLLDIEEVLSNKSPLLKKLLPGFFISYMKRLIHQEWLNHFLKDYHDDNGVDFIDKVLGEMNTKLEMKGLENIPETGRYLIASNHPLGGLDGMALMLAVSKVRKDIVFPVNDILLNIKNLKEMFIPINKHGSNTENIKIINDTFASDKLICYFPFGFVSRKRNGKIMDLEWKTTFLTKAKRFKRDIIPTHINGRNTDFFYNLANLRKKMGLKINIEMLFLVDEMYKQQNKTLVFTFSKPVPYDYFDNRYNKNQWAELLRQFVYQMDRDAPASFMEWMESGERNPGI